VWRIMSSIGEGPAGVGSRGTHRGQSGFSLAELLVGVTVTAIMFVAVFTLYDNLQQSFKLSENAVTQQQNTRVAFDRMVADLRMAGFNHNPDGDPNRPDEQVEGMWGAAVTIRGDYDFEDAGARTSPETTLGGSSATFRTVSTGNDEIITYGLGKPAGPGGDSINFVADVLGVPRNGSQETVTLSNVYLTQTDPPYTLYKYIVAPNSTSIIRQPVADNIKSLRFTYYDDAGTALAPIGGADDPNSIAQRKAISKVGIEIVGLTEDPDLAYMDPADPIASTRHNRKFTLAADVSPRNLGHDGVVDMDEDDPNQPVNFTACQGHCLGTLLKLESGGDPDIAGYDLSWGSSATSLLNVLSTNAQSHYVTGVSGATFYAARSIDLSGNQSPLVLVGPSSPSNTTIPEQVTGVAATGDAGATLPPERNQIHLSWDAILGNTTDLACDVAPFPIRDLLGYKLFKGAVAGFDPNNPAQVLEVWDPNDLPATVTDLVDVNVVNCRRYFYKVLGTDLCNITGAISLVVDGASTTNVPPAAPTAVSANDIGGGHHRVTWSRVTQNSDPTPESIVIDKYAVYRAVVATGQDPNLATYSQEYSGLVSDPANPEFDDTSVPAVMPGESYFYKISALDDCVNNESALSLPDEADACSFGGSVSMTVVPGISPIVGVQTVTLTASGTSVQSTQLLITDMLTSGVVFNQTDSAAPYSYSWNSTTAPSWRNYEIKGIVTNTSGCNQTTISVVSKGL